MNNAICTLFDNILIDIYKFKSFLNMERTLKKLCWHIVVVIIMIGGLMLDQSIFFHRYGLIASYIGPIISILYFILCFYAIMDQMKYLKANYGNLSQKHRVCHVAMPILHACYIVMFVYCGIKDLQRIL